MRSVGGNCHLLPVQPGATQQDARHILVIKSESPSQPTSRGETRLQLLWEECQNLWTCCQDTPQQRAESHLHCRGTGTKENSQTLRPSDNLAGDMGHHELRPGGWVTDGLWKKKDNTAATCYSPETHQDTIWLEIWEKISRASTDQP